MGKIIKKGALTNFVLVTIFEHEYESVEEVAVIYIKYDNLIDFIEQLKKSNLRIRKYKPQSKRR